MMFQLHGSVFENLIVACLVKKCPTFIESKWPFSCSQESAIGPNSEPEHFSPHSIPKSFETGQNKNYAWS
jgi:hypothetical protein